MQDELLERLAALRDDDQANGLAAGDERLLDRMAARDQFFVLTDQIAGRRTGGLARPGGCTRRTGPVGSPVGEAARTGAIVRSEGRPGGALRAGERLAFELLLLRLGLVRALGFAGISCRVEILSLGRLGIDDLAAVLRLLPRSGVLGAFRTKPKTRSTRTWAGRVEAAAVTWARP